MKKILLFILFPILSFAQISPGVIPLSTNASPSGSYTFTGANGFSNTTTINYGFFNTLQIGANTSGSGLTSSTGKTSGIIMPTYSASSFASGFQLLLGSAGSGTNNLSLGGGSGSTNSATSIQFYTSTGASTLIGTNRLTIDNNGGVGINQATPNANALLDIVSTTKGVLFPRMTTTQKNAIASPAEGLIVYDITLHKLTVYTGSVWESITSL